jgi:hypothetical protein
VPATNRIDQLQAYNDDLLRGNIVNRHTKTLSDARKEICLTKTPRELSRQVYIRILPSGCRTHDIDSQQIFEKCGKAQEFANGIIKSKAR